MNNKRGKYAFKNLLWVLPFIALGFGQLSIPVPLAPPDLALQAANSNSAVIPAPGARPAGMWPGMNKDWLARIKIDLLEREYHPEFYQQRLQAPNRRHNLRTYFEPAGVRLHDRSAPGSPVLVELSLTAIGRGDKLKTVAGGSVNHQGSRVEIEHPGGIVEWYENFVLGLSSRASTSRNSRPGRAH